MNKLTFKKFGISPEEFKQMRIYSILPDNKQKHFDHWLTEQIGTERKFQWGYIRALYDVIVKKP